MATLRVVERAFEPEPVNGAERRAALDEPRFREMADQGAEIDPGLVPAHKPAWSGFFFDGGGYLWVVRGQEDEEARTLDVFDPVGRYTWAPMAVDVPILSRKPAPIVRGDRLNALVRNEFDVVYVVRFRIEGRLRTQ